MSIANLSLFPFEFHVFSFRVLLFVLLFRVFTKQESKIRKQILHEIPVVKVRTFHNRSSLGQTEQTLSWTKISPRWGKTPADEIFSQLPRRNQEINQNNGFSTPSSLQGKITIWLFSIISGKTHLVLHACILVEHKSHTVDHLATMVKTRSATDNTDTTLIASAEPERKAMKGWRPDQDSHVKMEYAMDRNSGLLNNPRINQREKRDHLDTLVQKRELMS